jgi:hypothetical protein
LRVEAAPRVPRARRPKNWEGSGQGTGFSVGSLAIAKFATSVGLFAKKVEPVNKE